MNNQYDESEFQPINRAYNSTFRPGRLSLGLVVPLENYTAGPVPSMTRHVERVQLAEELGFSAIWLRDVPFNVPSFGDAGQMFDPFVYLGLLAGQTERIALGVASIVLPLRHPAHVAKACSQRRCAIGWATHPGCCFRRPARGVPGTQFALRRARRPFSRKL